MKEWLEETNDCIREALPTMLFVLWLIMICIILRCLYTGAIR